MTQIRTMPKSAHIQASTEDLPTHTILTVEVTELAPTSTITILDSGPSSPEPSPPIVAPEPAVTHEGQDLTLRRVENRVRDLERGEANFNQLAESGW